MVPAGSKPPVAILVEPQMGENIGMAARAMANFGWRRLRLVRPRDGWPSAKAVATASLGLPVIEAADLYDSLEDALADLSLVFATSARRHDMAKPVIGPGEAAAQCVAASGEGRVGYVFGREAWGLTNDEVALCDSILTLPVDPQHASLNVAQAVLVCAYEWRRAALAGEGAGRDSADERAMLPLAQADRSPPADKAALAGLFGHLEGLLDASGFFRPAEKRPVMVRNLRAIFQRARLNLQEVRTLRGVFASLDRAHERAHERRGRPTKPPG